MEEILSNNNKFSNSINSVGTIFSTKIKSLLGYNTVSQSIKYMHHIGAVFIGWEVR
jgi:hypothetical protein